MAFRNSPVIYCKYLFVNLSFFPSVSLNTYLGHKSLMNIAFNISNDCKIIFSSGIKAIPKYGSLSRHCTYTVVTFAHMCSDKDMASIPFLFFAFFKPCQHAPPHTLVTPHKSKANTGSISDKCVYAKNPESNTAPTPSTYPPLMSHSFHALLSEFAFFCILCHF